MNKFTYAFFWLGDLHVGVPLLDEQSELVVYAPEAIDVEIGETIIENGRAVVPVRLHNKTGEGGNHEIRLKFEEQT